MLLVDDLLLGPFRGLLWVVEKINEAAQEELANEADAITEELRQLYMMLETGRITEAEFDAQERRLLDRLESIRARAEESDSDDEADEDDDDNRGSEDEEEDGEA
ncbi:MAG: gas vesicle protein GvpG [Planctomycetes bacterium]|nr:gas vesicle protein GvpG [Acidobacteriota bacterium]MBI3465561.1 gas vesicle protein GvpG [Planctomycetota bacterium]